MKKYILIFSAFVLLMPFLALAQSDNLTESKITFEDLDVTDPGILPTSNFYFFKELVRGFQRAVTFNAVSRAELELKIVNEKAAELKKVSENDEALKGLEKAVTNYKESTDRLRTRFEALKETSESPNVDKLLDKLTDRVLKHSQLFEELKAKNEELKDKIEDAKGNLEEITTNALERLDRAENLKERLEKTVEMQREKASKEIRALEVFGKLEERAKSDELRQRLSEVKNGLVEKIEIRFSGAASSTISQILENLPVTAASRLKTLEELKEKTAESALRKSIDNVRVKVESEAGENRIGKEDAEKMIKSAEGMINDLKARLESGKYNIIPESVKSLLERAGNNLINANTAFKSEKYGEAFGQASAAVTGAKNAIAQLSGANSVLPDKAYRKKLEDLEKCGIKPGAPGNWVCKDGGWKLEPEELFCAQVYEPVCGVDGKTYGNACEARVAGVAVKSRGECLISGTDEAYRKKLEDLEKCGIKPGAPGNWVCKDGGWKLMPEETSAAAPKTWTVEHANNRFTPRELKIKKGDTVTWVNKSGILTWPASAMHPTHQVYPGFDALKGLGKEESYSFKFDRVGSWKYHDHLNPSSTGVVVVE